MKAVVGNQGRFFVIGNADIWNHPSKGRHHLMWTNENTPLIIAVSVAAGCLLIGTALGTPLSIVISAIIGILVILKMILF